MEFSMMKLPWNEFSMMTCSITFLMQMSLFVLDLLINITLSDFVFHT
jgi:hypothetical protein